MSARGGSLSIPDGEHLMSLGLIGSAVSTDGVANGSGSAGDVLCASGDRPGASVCKAQRP